MPATTPDSQPGDQSAETTTEAVTTTFTSQATVKPGLLPFAPTVLPRGKIRFDKSKKKFKKISFLEKLKK